MANVDAFNSGFDMGMGAAGKAKKPKSDGDNKKNKGKKKGGGSKDDKSSKKQDGFGAFGDYYPAAAASAVPSSFKKGGVVKKTGKALVHKGEVVLTAAQAKTCGKKGSKKTLRKRVASKG